MIKIRDLTFEYFDRDDEGNLTEMVNAIRGINFDAGEGEFIVVAGVKKHICKDLKPPVASD